MENKYISYAKYVGTLVNAISNKESIYSRKREGEILECLLETNFAGCDIASWDFVYPHCNGYYDITKLDFDNYVYASEEMLFKENYDNLEKEAFKEFMIMENAHKKLKKLEGILNKYHNTGISINYKYMSMMITQKEAEWKS